jgi:hypothetical protein
VGERAVVDRDALDTFERTARGVLAQPDIDVARTRADRLATLDADATSAVPLVFGLLGELLLAGRSTTSRPPRSRHRRGPRAAGHASAIRSCTVMTGTATGGLTPS